MVSQELTEQAARLQQLAKSRIAAAEQRYTSAQAVVEQLRRDELEACRARDEALADLRREMEGRTRVLVGGKLITRNAHGGVQIEPVDLLGDLPP